MKSVFYYLWILLIIAGCGSGGGSSSSTNNPIPPQTTAAMLTGSWTGDFSNYTCDVTLTTSDNINYTGHIIARQKPLWPGTLATPEWIGADIQGMFNLPATATNIVSTYALNGGNAGLYIMKDNTSNAKIACGVSLYFGGNSWETDYNKPDWLTKL